MDFCWTQDIEILMLSLDMQIQVSLDSKRLMF